MGCTAVKDGTRAQSDSDSLEIIQGKIFSLLKDNFCASGAEASLFGAVLKEEMIMKLRAKRAKIETSEKELQEQNPADYFINKVAHVDPAEGEIVITYDRIISVCEKFEVDELYMLYERLRHIKVARLRQKHGNDIVSILDDEGMTTYSECGRRDYTEYRPPPPAREQAQGAQSSQNKDQADLAQQDSSGGGLFDVRNLRL